MSRIPLSMMPPDGFVFKKIADRPFRTISIETEVDGDGRRLAETLHKHGLVVSPRVERFGFKPPRGYYHPGFIKFDNSVTGGEVVLDRLNLTLPEHASALLQVLERLRGLEKAGEIQYNPNCGGHIHMDAHMFGLFDAVRLLDVFGHIEEPVVRLAGAGKTYGHRSLFKGHDSANGGQGYSNPVIKGPFTTLPRDLQLITSWGDNRRMSCLNFKHYAQSYCSQSCVNVRSYSWDDGIRSVADFKDCTHVKPFSTIEWRVWNSQGNPRILYAWIGLMQALHAYVCRPSSNPKYQEVDNLPPLAWEKKPWSKMPASIKSTVQDRVVWMFSELPLTAEEKDALAYTYLRTPYKEWGSSWFRRLADTPYKPPPFKAAYTDKVSRLVKIVPFGEAPAPVSVLKEWGSTTNSVTLTFSQAMFSPPPQGGN